MRKNFLALAVVPLLLLSCGTDDENEEFANSGFLRVNVVVDGRAPNHPVRVGLDQVDGLCKPMHCGLKAYAGGRWGGALSEGRWRLVPRAYPDIGKVEPILVTIAKGEQTKIWINYTGKP